MIYFTIGVSVALAVVLLYIFRDRIGDSLTIALAVLVGFIAALATIWKPRRNGESRLSQLETAGAKAGLQPTVKAIEKTLKIEEELRSRRANQTPDNQPDPDTVQSIEHYSDGE